MERKFRMIVTRISESEFSVLSLNLTSGRPKQYAVRWNNYRWICSCPDFAKHSEEIDYVCKHIEAMFKAVKKIGWIRGGIEVEVMRRYRRFSIYSRNGEDAGIEGSKGAMEMTA